MLETSSRNSVEISSHPPPVPESAKHATLVSILHQYIADRFCDGDKDRIFVDSSLVNSSGRPPSIATFIPDTYVMLNNAGRVVIGEAKSLRDLENSHTDEQVTAFLQRCGLSKGSVLVMAVPWTIERLAKSILTKLRHRERLPHVEIVILSDANQQGTVASSEWSPRCRS